MTEAENLRREIEEEIEKASSPEDFENIRIKYFGKKGLVTKALKSLKDLPIEKRKEAGALLNALKKEFEPLLKKKREEAKVKAHKKSWDYTLPGRRILKGNLHPLTLVELKIREIFSSLGFKFVDGPYIETDWYNFEALNVPPHHPAREMHDTFYVKNMPGLLLRTHTSPVQIRTMEKIKPPVRVGHIGRVFRVDAFDASHAPAFTQFEGLYVDKGVSFRDLKGTIMHFIYELFGKGTEVKFLPTFFPFTEPSAEVYMKWKGEWMEILGCGMVHPRVLKNVGIDPEKYTGFAFGMGVERIAMIKYGIKDIRLFSENNLKFLRQFKI